ncbi:MAG: DUF695 domain-containing protein [Planctomycetaceae bacterium]|jgi:regulator of RNase E activity RraB
MEDWDFYVAPVDDQNASIFVDLGLFESAPEADRPCLLRVATPLLAPREDGLSDDAETEALYGLEDLLFAQVARGLQARYVGRMTTQGRREFFYYGASGAGLERAIATVQQAFPQYPLQHSSRDDRDWQLFFDVLYPSELDLQSIQTRRVVQELLDQGDDLSVPREVTHTAYFPSPHARDQFVQQLAPEGFRITLDDLAEPDAEYRFGARLSRVDRVDLEAIDALVIDLYLRIGTLGGEYDGWETELRN